MSIATAWEEVDQLLSCYLGGVKLEMIEPGHWDGELRLVTSDPEDAPARSMTFFSRGCGTAEDTLERLLRESDEWLREGGDPLEISWGP